MASVRGMVRYLAEQFAEFYDGYPQIVATGGDAGILENDGLVEHFVPDLQLLGIATAFRRAMDGEE
jgi:pantothenate kinase type III